MKLYDLKAGTNPRRVRIFLAEKGVTIPSVEVDMTKGENKAPDYLAKNPMGTMPLLELDDGSFIAESIAICRYIEALHPTPPLFGTGAREIAHVEMWNRRMEIELLRPITDVFVHTSPFWVGKRTQFADYGRHMHTVAIERMRWLDGELAGRPFIAGASYTVADITAQSALLLGRNTGTPMPPDLPNLQRWWAAVSARPTARA
jgi:glutathione S-transferase